MTSPQQAHGRVSVKQQVYETLHEAIVEMRLRPGQRLVERELIEMTGASRTTVREALNLLAGDGLVRTVPHNQTVVAFPTVEEADELYEVRGLLESVAIRRFAERASDEEITRLEHTLDAYAGADEVTDRLREKDAFYALIGQHAPTVYSLLTSLHARIALLRRLSLSEPGRHERSVAEMREITDAINEREAKLAEELSVAHAHKARETAIAALRRNPWYSA